MLAPRGRSDPCEPATADRRGRRRDLQRGHEALAKFASQTGIPVAKRRPAKAPCPSTIRSALGAIGVTGTLAANRLARDADLVIGIGTRYSDFTTASKTAFQNPDVRFVNINVAEFDAYKVSAIPVVADARVALEQLAEALPIIACPRTMRRRCRTQGRMGSRSGPAVPPESIPASGTKRSHRRDVGSLRTARRSAVGGRQPSRRPAQALAHAHAQRLSPGIWLLMHGLRDSRRHGREDWPIRRARFMSSWATAPTSMMPTEIVTSVQEGIKIIIVLVDNHGFASIGGLSQVARQQRLRDPVPVSAPRSRGNWMAKASPSTYVANARSLGAHAIRAGYLAELKEALAKAKALDRTTVIVVRPTRAARVPGYESWWDVAVAEVSEHSSVRDARSPYENRAKERAVSPLIARHDETSPGATSWTAAGLPPAPRKR